MLDTNTYDKLQQLRGILQGLQNVAVAYSGGVDSTLLAKVAHDTLGNNACAVTAKAAMVPGLEVERARTWCHDEGMAHHLVDVDMLSVPGFADNPPDRCYLCKRVLFDALGRLAADHGNAVLVEGSNVDDLGDYRPGLRALRELGVRSPLQEAGLFKSEVRALARELGIPVWNKPAAACLASRIAYGEHITPPKLMRVERAESLLHELGFGQLRVRVHGPNGDLARIELEGYEMHRMLDEQTRQNVVAALKELGFLYVSLDLAGFRSGSMNDTLPSESSTAQQPTARSSS